MSPSNLTDVRWARAKPEQLYVELHAGLPLPPPHEQEPVRGDLGLGVQVDLNAAASGYIYAGFAVAVRVILIETGLSDKYSPRARGPSR